jgi:hypothetical protein
MFSNQLVNHFIDTFSTNAVVPVVGWVEALAETHHIHPPSIRGLKEKPCKYLSGAQSVGK